MSTSKAHHVIVRISLVSTLFCSFVGVSCKLCKARYALGYREAEAAAANRDWMWSGCRA